MFVQDIRVHLENSKCTCGRAAEHSITLSVALGHRYKYGTAVYCDTCAKPAFKAIHKLNDDVVWFSKGELRQAPIDRKELEQGSLL